MRHTVSLVRDIDLVAGLNLLGVIVPLGGTGILISSGEAGIRTSSIPGIGILVASLL